MKSQAVGTAISLLLVLGIGCSSSNGSNPSATGGASGVGGGTSTGGAGGGASTVVVTCPAFTKDSENNNKVAATEASNYTFSSKVTLGKTHPVKAKTDITFNWSGLTKDMFGATMDPKADVGNLGMILVPLTKEQLEQKINDDSFDTENRAAAATLLTGGTLDQASTAEFGLLGNPIQHDVLMGQLDSEAYPPSTHTYMFMVGSGDTEGKDGRMLTLFSPTADATSSVVTVDNGDGATTCDYSATLDKLTPVVVPTGTANVFFDWSALTKNAAGRTVDFVGITRVMVASYTQPVADLQKKENFLKLEEMATDTWTSTDLYGTTVVFSTLKKADGTAFTGIDSTHTWIIALENTGALNPAPWFITVLQPCK